MRMILKVIGLLLITFSLFTVFSYYSWRSVQRKRLETTSAIVETERGPIEYREWGDGSGPAVLFFHGTPGGYDQYNHYSSPDRPGMRVFAVSRPGYLRTPLSVGDTLNRQAEAFASFLDAQDIQRAFIMGVSGGGPAAIEFAAMYPERTIGLIAAQAVSQPMGSGCIDDNVILLDRIMQSDFFSWVTFRLTQWRPEILVSALIPDQNLRNRILDDPYKLESFKRLTGSVTMPSLREDGVTNDACNFFDLNLPLENITSPTLILHGIDDSNVPYSFAEELAARVNDSDLITFEGDHYITYTHREEYWQIIDGFIKQHNN